MAHLLTRSALRYGKTVNGDATRGCQASEGEAGRLVVSPASEARSGAQDGSVKSVDRAISILQVLGHRGDAGVTELSTALSVPKSTVSRLLATLEARGLVEQSSLRGSYRLGHGAALLAGGAGKKQDLALVSREICRALAAEVGETAYLAVHEGDTALTIDQVMGSAMIGSLDWIGKRDPLHVTACGKVFLAWMSAPDLHAYMDRGLREFTDSTICDPVDLQADLALVRSRGYAVTRDEYEVGLTAVAAPVHEHDGTVGGAICISGPSFRLADAVEDVAGQVLSAARQISEKNGYPKIG